MRPTLESPAVIGLPSEMARLEQYLATLREIILSMEGYGDADDRFLTVRQMMDARLLDVVGSDNKTRPAGTNALSIRQPSPFSNAQKVKRENVGSALRSLVSGHLFHETFETQDFASTWTNLSSLGAVAEKSYTYPANGLVGARLLSINSVMFYEFPINIPYDRGALHRMRIRFRKQTNSTAGDALYCGVQGYASDGVTRVDTTGGSNPQLAHYVVLNGLAVNGLGTASVEYTGYFQGTGAYIPAASSIGSPSGIHASSRYIRPIVAVNWSNGDGNVELDAITIDIL